MNNYTISDTNPNDAAGGRGCLCSDSHVEDSTGPYIIWHAIETDSLNSPHAVQCARCVLAVADDLIEAEVLSAGEADPVDDGPIDVEFEDLGIEDLPPVAVSDEGEEDPLEL